MKRLFLLSIVFALFSCSSGDDDNNSNSTNPDLVGAWFTTFTDDGSTAEQTFIFQSDGTGSVSNLWDDGETYYSEFTWSSTATKITMSNIDDEEEIVDYELSNNNNTLVFNVNENETYIFTRI